MRIRSNFIDLSENSKGFTLLEILIAIFILAVVLSTVYAAYRGTFRIIKESEDDGDAYGMARSAMERMFKDLSAVSTGADRIEFVSRSEEAGRNEFTGLEFVSGSHLDFSAEGGSSGLAKITYYIEEDAGEEGNYRLLRKDVLLAEADSEEQESEFVLCEHLQSLTFKFFDTAGGKHESWDSTSDGQMQKKKVPAIVAIELEIANRKDEDRPYVFSTKVFLPLSSLVSPLL